MTLLDYRLTETNTIPLDGLASHVGNTPLLPLRRVIQNLPHQIQIFAKAEWFNPGGSVKDRLAIGIIEDAEQRGVLAPGQTVVEATSGNTGSRSRWCAPPRAIHSSR